MPSTPKRAITRRSLVLAAGGALAAAGAAVGAKSLLLSDEPSAAAPARRRRVATDVTELEAFLADLRSGDAIELVAGTTYVLNRTITLRGRDLVLDGAGATVRLAGRAARDDDRVIDVIGTRNTVQDLVIGRRANRANSSDHAWTVQVVGDDNVLQRCTVDVASGYALGIAGGDGNTIADNTVTGGGILYGWDDVTNTTCVRNTVSRSHGNAFSGIGNSDSGRPVRGCVVADNTVTDCGRIAIEDFSNVVGSRIERNTITGSRYMGISAVGARTVVAQNLIQDGGRDYGIETGASGNEVRDNLIRWSVPGRATGLIVNDRWKFGNGAGYSGFRSSGNRITNARMGITLAGRLPSVRLDSDVITDSAMRGISVEPTSAESVRITDAKIFFSLPSTKQIGIRDGVSVANISRVTLDRCDITYSLTTAGPTKDYFVRVESRGVSITDCVFDAAGRRDLNRPVVGSVTGSAAGRYAARGNRFVMGG